MKTIKALNTYRSQQGVVLIVSLVFLIALTSVVGMLMQNTTTDIKMSGASEEKSVARQEAVSAIDEVIFNQVNKTAGTNLFTSDMGDFLATPDLSINVNSTFNNTTATIQPADPNLLEVDCQASESGSSAGIFRCNIIQVRVTRAYGRTNNSIIEVNAGVTQLLLNTGK